MSSISKITTQKKNKGRYNIYLDDGQGEEYAFSVEEAVLVKFQLHKGMVISEEIEAEIQHEDGIRKGYHYALNYLSYRMRSTKEVVSYLQSKEINEEVITLIIQRLQAENYINDLEFSKAFVQSKINLTFKGPENIKKELIEKGIRENYIAESLKIYTEGKQLEKALNLIRKKATGTSKISKQEQQRKMYTLLLSKGFSQQLIQEAIKMADEEIKDDSLIEWNAIVYQGDKAYNKYRNSNGWEKKQKIKQFLYRRGFSFDLIEQYIMQVEENNE